MKKIVDDERLIYKVCSLYYQDNMNQQEVGDFLGVSRSSVLRMLQRGKELGIVTIELHNPRFYDYGKMEKQLEKAYGLKDVLIVENSVLDTRQEAASYMFGSASDYLDSFFKFEQALFDCAAIGAENRLIFARKRVAEAVLQNAA